MCAALRPPKHPNIVHNYVFCLKSCTVVDRGAPYRFGPYLKEVLAKIPIWWTVVRLIVRGGSVVCATPK